VGSTPVAALFQSFFPADRQIRRTDPFSGYLSPGSGNPGVSVFSTSPQSYGLPINSVDMQLYLLPVAPEPGTLALAGLGGLTLFLFRRRQKRENENIKGHKGVSPK
jgi:hypothetical protein